MSKLSRNVKNTKELDNILELINKNRFCLKDALLDAEVLTGDRVNNLDIDELENVVTNDIKIINMWEVQKDSRSKNRVDYLINADIYIEDKIYRIKNWFAYLKNQEIFEDSLTLTDNLESGLI